MPDSKKKTENGQELKVKLMLQQCTSAELDLSNVGDSAKSEDDANGIGECGAPEQDGKIKIGRGLIIYVCFLAGCESADVAKAAASALAVRLSEPPGEESAKRTAVTQAVGDILVVPQATIGGKMKGRMFQYHKNVDKGVGAGLYAEFVQALKDGTTSVDEWKEAGCKIKCGKYGARQVLSMVTNGPFTHIIDL